MSLSKEIVLSIGDYAIQLSGNLNFYVNDTLDLIFTLNKWGIKNEHAPNETETFDLNGLSAFLMIEDKNLSDHIEALSIADNKITFRLTKKYTMMAGTGRMQIKLVDGDGCELKLPPFKYEIQNTINEWNDLNPTNQKVLTTDNRSALLTSDGRLLLMSITSVDNPNLVRINDLEESKVISYRDHLLVNVNGITKRIPVNLIKISETEQMDIARIPGMVKSINDIATKGTTVEVVKNATEEEIRKQITLGNLTHMVIANDSIDGNKIKKNTITNSNISDVSILKISESQTIASSAHILNLYNKETMYKQGHWTDNGNFDPSANYYSTGYIEVKPSTTYTKCGIYTDAGFPDKSKGEPLAFFDINKNRIGSVIRDNTFRTPNNCAYINTLLRAPGAVENSQYSMYPYSVNKENFAIVEGNELPPSYPNRFRMSYKLKGLIVDSDHIKDQAITARHLAKNLKLNTVHAGDDTPPETALLWFKPPYEPPQSDGGGNDGDGNTDFITEGLVIYIDGRFGNIEDNTIPNRGSGGGTFYHKEGGTVIDTPIICEDGWYKCIPGARACNHQALNAPDIVNLSHFEGEDITIMVRCRIPLGAAGSTHDSPISMGSMPGWIGFYFKPCLDNNTFRVDHNPNRSTVSRAIGDLRGKDVVLTMRKSGTTLDLFVNSLHCGSGTHTNATIAAWKSTTTLEFEIGGLGEIGSGLIYGRALSNEEIERNVSAEANIRSGLSEITVANEIVKNVKDPRADYGNFRYKSNAGGWKNIKFPADMIETSNKSNVQKELTKNAEAIKQLSVNGGNAGYVTSPSGVKFKLCVTDSGQLYTTMMKMPRVDIIGSLSGIGKDKPVWAELKYEGEISFHKRIKAEWQGSTSIGFPKKNYSIDLYELDGATKCSLSFRDWPSNDSFHLKANWIDATHARNILCARWAKQIWRSPLPNGARGVIDGFPVELYHDGQYQGIYTWNLKQNKELFKMDKKNENHLMYRADFHENSGSFADWSNADIHRVWENRIPKGVTQHTRLARVIQWVATVSDTDFKANISQYLDLKSCIDYYVMMQIMYLQDNRRKNMTMATWDGNLWYPVFYDLDTSWGLHWNGQSTFHPETPIEEDSILWEKLARNFGDQIKSRYVELRRTVFTKTNIINEFQIFADIIGKTAYANDQSKWPGIPSKNFGIPFIKTWINTRFAYFDKKYGVTLDD